MRFKSAINIVARLVLALAGVLVDAVPGFFSS